jgi:N-acetylmuramoyl-L-alanine amidase
MSNNNINYFEPNDFDFNVEDLCVGVKLEVAVPGRAISASNDNTTISWQTIIEDANLFGGTDGYLSTSYSDISSLDAHSGGNKDSFGIEYINIHYNSWNFPEIDMKLIDIRGNALMNPLESRKDDNTKKGSFLNALFTFPYPIFKLTVKGYYGKPVTYKLTVRDVRTNFNASNGNFEITVKFIGYMFGYLNDIPMQYLLIAPDINYDGKTHLLGTFSDNDKHTIPTFREFLKSTTDAIKMISENQDIGKYKHDARRINGSITIFDDILQVVRKINDELTLAGTVYKNVFTITRGDGDESTTFTFSQREKDDNDTVITDDAVKTTINTIRGDLNRVINNHNKYIKDYDIDSSYRVKAIDDLKSDNNDFLNVDKSVDPKNFKLIYNYEELYSAVQGKSAALSSDKQNNDELMSAVMGSAYTQTMGWQPTVGNIFEMVLAHFNCFYENYYECISNIKGSSSSRNLRDLNVTTDCRTIGGANQTVPPYPLLTNERGGYQWIGSVTEMSETYQEKFFIEDIVKGATATATDLAKTALEYDLQREFASFPKKGIPTLLSDIYNGGMGNPYKGTSFARGKNGELPTAIQVFAKRLFLRYCFNGGEYAELSAENFAKLEALNCFREHLSLDELNYIKIETCWAEGNINSEIIQFIKDFTNYKGDYVKLSILYNDYAKAKITADAVNGHLKMHNSTFKDGDTEIVEYEDMMLPVYDYLNAYQGNTTATFQHVFPSKIPVLLNEIFDNVIVDREDRFGNNMKTLTMEYKIDTNLSDAEKSVQNENGTKIFGDFIEYYHRVNGKMDDDDILEYFLQNINVIYDNVYKHHGEDITIKNQLNILIKPTLEKYGIVIIPEIIFAYYYYKSKSYDFANYKNFIEKKGLTKKYYLNKIKMFLNSCKDTKPQNTSAMGYNYYHNLSEKSQKILNEILSETVTLYNLHGTYRKYDDNMVGEKVVLGVGEIFSKTIQDLYKKMDETQYRITTQRNEYSTPDKKIAIYMTMKELYDRWKFGTWRPDVTKTNEQNLMVSLDNFVFLDSHYDDIKQKHYINFDVFADLVRNIVDTSKEMSVYSFFYEICKAANMTLHALPINVYDYLSGKESKIREMFTAYPYMACEDSAMQTTYVAMYAHKPSEHLNIVDPYNSYEDDGIDFRSNGTVIKSEKPLPVFGVTYGMEKQRFFKNISVGSDNPKTTAHSLMSELLISKQATSGSQNLGFEAHDIFDVYASKSYTCRVEMMGNSMLMPMMYFQLNNIPMFKGGYFIINAEHNISRNGMTTTFTGVRVNKNRFDLLPKNIPDVQTYAEESGSGLFGENNRKDSNINVSETDVTNRKLNSKAKFFKEEVHIILDAGHDMTVDGKESPQFDVYDINNISTVMQDRYKQQIIKTTPTIQTGDTEINGSLRPLSKTRKEEYQPNTGINNQGRTRYREYWGNRKIVNEIKRQLMQRGISEDRITIMSTEGRNAPSFDKKYGKTYSKKVNEIYDANNGQCIMISIHSNAEGSSVDETTFLENGNRANYWSIYCQNNNEYIKGRGLRKNIGEPIPHEEDSWSLAHCILESMKSIIMGEDFKQNFKGLNTNKLSIGNEVKVFTDTEEGIRPLTYAKPPTVLSENFFHTSADGVRILGSKKGVELIAKAHVDGIMNFLGSLSLPNSFVNYEPNKFVTYEEGSRKDGVIVSDNEYYYFSNNTKMKKETYEKFQNGGNQNKLVNFGTLNQ